MNRITATQVQREVGDGDHGANLHVRGPDGGAAAAPGRQAGLVGHHEIPLPSLGGGPALRGVCHMVGTPVHEK